MKKENKENLENKYTKHKVLGYLGRTVSAGIIAGGLMLSSYTFIADPLIYRTYTNDLPSFDEANDNLEATGYNTDINWYQDCRFVFPASGKVKVNVFIPEEKRSDRFIKTLESSIDEINDVLNMINPNYRLEIEYNPSGFDKLYCFNLYESDMSSEETATSRTVGFAQGTQYHYTKNGIGRYAVDVDIDLDYCESICRDDDTFFKYVKYILCHEIAGHGLASMKDAYKLEDYPYQTIMEYANNEGRYFSKSDLMIMFSLYSNNSNYDEWERKINEYLSNQDWYKKLQQQVEFVKDNFYHEYVEKNNLQSYITTSDIKYQDIGEFYIRSKATLSANSEEDGDYTYKMIFYDGVKTNEKIETKTFLSEACNDILDYKLDEDFFIIDGVSCTENAVFVKIGEDSLVKVYCKYDENGNLAVNYCITSEMISKEAYEKEIEGMEKLTNRIDRNTSSQAVCADFVRKYLAKNGYEYQNIENVKEKMFGFKLADNENDAIIIDKENLYIGNNKYYFSIEDGFIFCSNGRILVLLDNNSIIELDIGFNFDKAEIEVSKTGEISVLSEARFNVSRQNSQRGE